MPALETRPVDPPGLERMLRAQLAAHNFRAALFATLTLFAAVALWWLLYAAVTWLAVLFSTAIMGLGAQPPRGIDEAFWTAAAALIALAWIDRRLHPDERPRDHKSPREIAWEFLLALPRLTLAVWGTLSAWLRLDAREIADAAALVARLEEEPRMLLSSMPLEIPDAARRYKILFALQLLELIDVRREDRELWVRLNPHALTAGGHRSP